MRKNGPVALIFHTLVIAFVLAPLVIVVLVAFTPDETLTLPTHGVSLRWSRDPQLPGLYLGVLQQPEVGVCLGNVVFDRRFASRVGHRACALSGPRLP